MDEWTVKIGAMDTQNVSKARTAGICLVDDERSLQRSGRLEIRWMGLETRGQGRLCQVPFLPSTTDGDSHGRVPD